MMFSKVGINWVLVILTLALLKRRITYGAELVTLVELGENGSPYSLSYIDPGLYIYGDGAYFGAFFLTGNGIVMIDAPSTFSSGTIRSIVDSVCDNEKIKYVVYSHHHLDHISNVWDYIDDDNTVDDIKFICHKDAFDKIKESSDKGLIPECNIVINVADMTDNVLTNSSDISESSISESSSSESSSDSIRNRDCLRILAETGILNVGYQSIEFDYYGNVHTRGNIWIYSSKQKFLMIVDFVAPGWVPYKFFSFAQDPGRYLIAHDIALDYYDFNYFIGGHMNKIGTPKDIELHADFMYDIYEAAERGINEFDISTITSFSDRYDFLKQFEDGKANKCVEILTSESQYTNKEWFNTLSGIYTYLHDNCLWIQFDFAANLGR